MTQYFEIENRDGAARIGKLLLSPELRTPCALHTAALGNLENPGPVVDAGSLWTVDREELQARIKKIREKTGKGTLIILPHQAYLPAIPADSLGKVETFTSSGNGSDENEGPKGSLLRAGGEVQKSDLYILEGAGTLENNARRFLETLIDLKNRIPPDTALYAPNMALPENAAMLAYVGIDVMDDTKAEIAAYSDIYLTAAGSFYLDSLTELPCRCQVCAATTPAELRALPKADRAKLLAAHNRDALDTELALVREKIRSGNLREYVEGQCRVKPWLTACCVSEILSILTLKKGFLLSGKTSSLQILQKLFQGLKWSDLHAEYRKGTYLLILTFSCFFPVQPENPIQRPSPTRNSSLPLANTGSLSTK